MRGGQMRLVHLRRSTHSSGRAHGLLPRLPCFLQHPSLSLSLFLFTGLVSTFSSGRARKAD